MTDLHRILYVEDEPDIREIGQLALVDVAGFEIQACASGEEACDKAVAFAPDLVLLDVMMPGMDGITTFHKLRDLPELADTPVIFMTAKVQTAEVQRYLALGALDVIPKPFDPMTLGDTIRRIWAR
ncbi:response regulator [Oceanibaculum pacificum]|uniref:Response regulatory domain-containing protein n=1 Tax=Oceanibaculum pacificum TaxID=580166 RepID=A0A154VYZ1_9PROT|nr:response regulator [Oceanibaculum pacificum]KZD06460.1 hypothetical protein AUP43_10745 [Oceanibaculum pacificum]